MALKLADTKVYGSALSGTGKCGGAIALVNKPLFVEVAANDDLQVVSSSTADDGSDGNQVTVYTRQSPAGVPNTMTGQTPNPFGITSATIESITLSFAANGDVAVEDTTATFTGTLASGTQDDVTLPAGASSTDDFYKGMVIRETNGAFRIREIIKYVGSTKVATVSRAWGGSSPTSTTTIRISAGAVFDFDTSVVTIVRTGVTVPNPFTVPGTTYYEKVFIKNASATDTMTGAQVAEIAGGVSGHTTFALATAINDSGGNGNQPNTVAPSSGVTAFDSTTKSVPGGSLSPGQAIGVWIKYSPPATEDSTLTLEFTSNAPTRDIGFPLESKGAAHYNYTPSGGVVFGGSGTASFVHHYGYQPTGGVVFGGEPVVTTTLQQIIFQILQAQSYPLAVFFDIVNTLDAPEPATVTFIVLAQPNGTQASFQIFSDALYVARTSSDVQQPLAEVDFL